MAIGILAAVLGLLLAAAAIVIPRMVARHTHPEDDEASRAYLASTGRSAEEVEQANQGGQAPSDGRPQAASLRALTVNRGVNFARVVGLLITGWIPR